MEKQEMQIGVFGMGVMGQNLALNIASRGIPVAVSNRSPGKVDDAVTKAKLEGDLPLVGIHDAAKFVASLKRPRAVIMLVQAGAAVDETIEHLALHMEAGDILIDGGNEFWPNTERRGEKLKRERGILYVGMGVSGGEEGARHGPSLMPGGPVEAYDAIKPVLEAIAARTETGPCVTHIGPAYGCGNFVKMVHNGIEYGDMQLIAEAYSVLKAVGKLSNDELASVFSEWNKSELDSYLIDITSRIFHHRQKEGTPGAGQHTVDLILDKTGMKGTGKWTVQEAAERSVAASTMSAALDARCLSGMLDERIAASSVLQGPSSVPEVDRDQLIEDVRKALYASKICSYAQGLSLIRRASEQQQWNVDLAECARIWTGGCIIRAKFLGRIRAAYGRDRNLASLLVDPEFAADLNSAQASWRRVVALCAASGIAAPAFFASLSYYDQYRQRRLPANLTQAQRDFFGAHTYERVDLPGSFHTEWARDTGREE